MLLLVMVPIDCEVQLMLWAAESAAQLWQQYGCD